MMDLCPCWGKEIHKETLVRLLKVGATCVCVCVCVCEGDGIDHLRLNS